MGRDRKARGRVNAEMHGYFRNYGCRLLEFNLLGYRTVTIENEVIRVTVLVDKGACIYELLHKPTDTDVLWRWQRGLRPRHYVESIPHPRGSFQEHFAGGWDEMFPTFGPTTSVGGLPIGYHGEVAAVPWDYVVERNDPDEVAVRFEVRTIRAPFLLSRTVRIRRMLPCIELDETASNEAAFEVSFAWGHHPTLGPPFLSSDCILETGARHIVAYASDTYERGQLAVIDQKGDWPLLIGRDGRSVDLGTILGVDARVSDCFYLTNFGETAWCAMTNRASQVGVALAWDKAVMPAAHIWQGFGGDDVAPWWGRSYTLAVEPLSGHPMDANAAARQGALLSLGPGASQRFHLTATLFTGGGPVRGVSSDGHVELAK
jgi:hypothetical protein